MTFPENERTTILTPRLRRTAIITASLAFLAVSLVLGNELMFLVTFSLLALMVLAKIFAYWTLRPLQFEATGTPEAIEGETVSVKLRLVNKGILPRYIVEVELTPQAGVEVVDSNHLVFGQLLPHQPSEASVKVKFHRRGFHPLGKAVLCSQDPLGLFIATREVQTTEQVLVYPQPKPLPMEPEGATKRFKWDESNTRALLPSLTGDEFWGVRPYQTGDPLRRIHWKITAHQGELSIIQTLPSFRQGGMILLDRHPAAHRPIGIDGETTLDELVRYAAYLIRQWVRHHWQVIFWAPPEPPIKVNGDWYPIWRKLALLETELFQLKDLEAMGQGVVLTTPYSPFLSTYLRTQGWQVWVLPINEGDEVSAYKDEPTFAVGR
ncbi:MAG: DUF58 domain-containing protein [Armatimonadetes bacterium]|nr:DUF58 domain-containing protein [Armatimonadota bacterium]MCX7967660.1 DUF58 domain-containing protein [Armatimonadota bacterium]MDW8143665.1 DUF58 domain-containing protein [Armatimonadota bacterium]